MLTRNWQRHTSNASIKKNDAKTPPTFLRNHVYKAVGSLPVMPSLLPPVH